MNEGFTPNTETLEAEKMPVLQRSFFKLQAEFAQTLAQTHDLSTQDALLKYTATHIRLFGDSTKGLDENWGTFAASLSEDVEEMTDAIYVSYLKHEEDKSQEVSEEKITFGCFSYEYNVLENAFDLHFGNNDPKGNLGKDRMDARHDDLVKLAHSMQSLQKEGACVQISSWLLNIDAFNRLMPAALTHSIEVVDTDAAQENAHWGQFLDKDGQVKPELAVELLKNAQDKNMSATDCFPLVLKKAKVTQEKFFEYYL